MRYLEAEEVLRLHSDVIEYSGGSHGLRDTHLFASIIEKAKGAFGGQELYVGVFMKAAVYAEAFAQYHVFVDGNKRTAFVTAVRFLETNGYEFIASNDDVVATMLEIATKRMKLPAIAAWLEKNCKKV
jgi:death-on-curing protein